MMMLIARIALKSFLDGEFYENFHNIQIYAKMLKVYFSVLNYIAEVFAF